MSLCRARGWCCPDHYADLWQRQSGAAAASALVCLAGRVAGTVITVTVMLGMGMLNPLLAVSTILIAQLGVAALIDSLGWLGVTPAPFTWHKVVGLVLMCAGVVLMKLKSA